MDIGAMSMIMSQTKVQENVGIAVMKMAMDTGRDNAASIIGTIKNAVSDPNLGNHLDVTV